MQALKLVDVHCHLGDESFKQDLTLVLERASSQGVQSIISSAITREEVEQSLKVSEQYPSLVFTTIGSDPTNLEEEWIDYVRGLIRAKRPKIIGIGEIGLDHYWVRESNERRRQLQLFQEWIELATELKLPVTVHSRSAGYEALQAVSSSGYGRILMHAYDGKVGHAMEAAEQGIFFSVPASVVYSTQKQKLVRRLPIERLMLETDAPVLSPLRGERNEPANVTYSAKKVAELKRLDLETVAEITTLNAVRFFELPNSS